MSRVRLENTCGNNAHLVAIISLQTYMIIDISLIAEHLGARYLIVHEFQLEFSTYVLMDLMQNNGLNNAHHVSGVLSVLELHTGF